MSRSRTALLLGLGLATGVVTGYILYRRAQARSRIFTPLSFRTASTDFVDHAGDLRRAMRGGKLGRAFGERVMLAACQVNGCRSCSFAHSRFALREGVPPEEVRALALGELDCQPEGAMVALLFAQHYAETAGHPEPEAQQRLVEAYGLDGAREVWVFLRLAMMTSLFSNTIEALWSRILGRPALSSSLRGELAVTLSSLWWFPAAIFCSWRRVTSLF
jgi:AhpD family alkylhydroperoxidase